MPDNELATLKRHELYLLTATHASHGVLYAPLADSALPVTMLQIQELAAALKNPPSASEEMAEVIKILCDVKPIAMREGNIRGEADFINLSILPNNICNFSCSYCYSAQGRSSLQLNLSKAKVVVDYFLSPQRNSSPLLTVSIFGGGEPLLSWKKLVSPLITYIYDEASRFSRKIVTTLITNGSIIPEGFIDACRKYDLDIVISYEILEDVQNVQRKHFELVTQNSALLINAGIIPAINSVITELNVNRQQEMVETLHRTFPSIRYLSFEPVIDNSISDKRVFYSHFMHNFMAARKKADACGITLTCSALRNVDVAVDRYCAGELALCADGSLSICPCVSSPVEENYQNYVYGRVADGKLEINSSKLQELLAVNVYQNEWCRDCFAKWNCGGGCMNANQNNGNKQDEDYCRFVQSFLKYTLIERLDKAYMEETGHPISELIGNYENTITE